MMPSFRIVPTRHKIIKMFRGGWSVTHDKWKLSTNGKIKIKFVAEYKTDRELW
jgi:hypothetical protein